MVLFLLDVVYPHLSISAMDLTRKQYKNSDSQEAGTNS